MYFFPLQKFKTFKSNKKKRMQAFPCYLKLKDRQILLTHIVLI